MSEDFHPHEPSYEDNVVPFERKESNLRSLYANDMTDIAIAEAINSLDQDEIRHIEAERRPIYILNAVLLALDVTPEVNSLYRPDESLDPAKRVDVEHALEVEKTIKRVRTEFDELSLTLSRLELSDYRDEMMKSVTETMSDTNLYRAFNQFRDSASVSQEVRMNGLVQAHRFSYALLYDYILKNYDDDQI